MIHVFSLIILTISVRYRPIIHFLFLGTIIYQFTDKGHKVIIEGLSWWFMILMLLSALYAHLWASHEYLLGEWQAGSLIAHLTHVGDHPCVS